MIHHAFKSLLLMAAFSASTAGQAIEIRLPDMTRTLHLEAARLLMTQDGSRTVCLSDEIGSVTTFAVTKWYNGQGMAAVIEVHGFGESRTYYWLTLRAPDLNSDPQLRIAKGRILENVERLTILNLKGPGDAIHVMLADPREIPDTKRRLVFFFQNNCAHVSGDKMGDSRRIYFSESAIQNIKNDSDFRIWHAEPTDARETSAQSVLRLESTPRSP